MFHLWRRRPFEMCRLRRKRTGRLRLVRRRRNAGRRERSLTRNPALDAKEPDQNVVKSAQAAAARPAATVRAQARNPAKIVRPAVSVPAPCATEKETSDAIAATETGFISNGSPLKNKSCKITKPKDNPSASFLRPLAVRFCGEYRNITTVMNFVYNTVFQFFSVFLLANKGCLYPILLLLLL